jgi:hypothetical protein
LHFRLITELGQLVNDATANDSVCGASSRVRDTVADQAAKHFAGTISGKFGGGGAAGEGRRRAQSSR